MVPYFGRHGCEQYIRNKPVKFGYKFWVAATPLGYAIQFCPYAGKDENYDSKLRLVGSVVATLTGKEKELKKIERGASDVVTGKNSNLTLVRWKGNKVVTVASTFVGKITLRKAQNGRAEIDQPQSIFVYNKGMGEVDRLDQNISS